MSEPTKNKEAEDAIIENKLSKENLLKDLNLVFSYARTHVANSLPLDESVMIGLIEYKKILTEIINKNS